MDIHIFYFFGIILNCVNGQNLFTPTNKNFNSNKVFYFYDPYRSKSLSNTLVPQASVSKTNNYRVYESQKPIYNLPYNSQASETLAHPVQHSTLIHHDQNYAQFQIDPQNFHNRIVPGHYYHLHGNGDGTENGNGVNQQHHVVTPVVYHNTFKNPESPKTLPYTAFHDPYYKQKTSIIKEEADEDDGDGEKDDDKSPYEEQTNDEEKSDNENDDENSSNYNEGDKESDDKHEYFGDSEKFLKHPDDEGSDHKNYENDDNNEEGSYKLVFKRRVPFEIESIGQPQIINKTYIRKTETIASEHVPLIDFLR